MKPKRAFTLVELLISISILLIVITIGIVQYETYDRQNNLILTADSLKSFIEAAKMEARSRSADQALATEFTTVSLEVDSTGRVINKYKNYSGGKKFVDSLSFSNKIQPLSPGSLLSFSVPAAGLSSSEEIINLSNDAGEQVRLIINENSITKTKIGF